VTETKAGYKAAILNQAQLQAVEVTDWSVEGGTRPARILALDLSTGGGHGKNASRPGWCLATGHEYQGSGIFEPAGERAPDRIAAIGAWLEGMMNAHRPDWVAVEEPKGDHGNRYTDRWLGIVVGVALEAARRAGASFFLVEPSRVKATGCHKGALVEAAAYVGEDEVTGDQADAIGVWLAVTVPAWRGESLL